MKLPNKLLKYEHVELFDVPSALPRAGVGANVEHERIGTVSHPLVAGIRFVELSPQLQNFLHADAVPSSSETSCNLEHLWQRERLTGAAPG